MFKCKSVRTTLVFFLAISFFTQLSFAENYAYFCVGLQQTCFKVLKSSVEKFPNSMLAKLIIDQRTSEVEMLPKAVLIEEAGAFKTKDVPHYFLRFADPQAFRTILQWIEKPDSISLMTQRNLNTVLNNANDLLFPELVESLKSKEVACPAGYVLVPGNPQYSTPTTGQDFCVMKYEATNHGSGVAQSKLGDGKTPWVHINRDEAAAACLANGAGYHLVTNAEWMVIARNIEATADNWNSGSDPTGPHVLSRGNSDSTAALAPSSDDHPYYGLPSHQQGDWTYKRTHVLSNGEMIWDVAGNVWEWVSDHLTTGQHQWQEYSSVYFKQASTEGLRFLYGPAGDGDSTKNMGKIYLDNGGALIRGGSWLNRTYVGVFAANHGDPPTSVDQIIGFRCAYVPVNLN